MRYDSFFDYALDDFHCSAAFVSAVALCFLFLAFPVQANYIYDNNTGTWTPTSRTVIAPPGSTSPYNHIRRESPPTVSSTGAFQNKTGGAFGSPPINGTSRTVPVTVTSSVPKPSVNKALLSRLGKGGLAGIALGAGIDALLDGIGALIDDAGNVSRPTLPPSSEQTPCFTGSMCWQLLPSNVLTSNPNAVCENGYGAFADTVKAIAVYPTGLGICEYTMDSISYEDGLTRSAVVISTGLLPEDLDPVPLPELEDAINSGYNPHPSDYPTISAEPDMMPQSTHVDPIPRISIPPAVTTTIDSDTGETTVVETNIWQDFNVKDNDTEQPKIEAETTTKSETFVDGDKTSETTITNNTGFANPEGAYDSAGNRLDIPPPVDCDLFPTACAWMEWTQEEPQEPDDDLSQLLQEVPVVSETFTITGGAAACPAPLVLNLSQFGSREVSYQPLCDLASTMKFLYLALMSFASAVLLHRSISKD